MAAGRTGVAERRSRTFGLRAGARSRSGGAPARPERVRPWLPGQSIVVGPVMSPRATRGPRRLRALLLALAAVAAIAAVLVALLGGGGSSAPATRAAGRGGSSLVQQAAGYLRLPAGAVRQRLRAGQTLGEIAATSKHGTASGLLKALYAPRAAAIRKRHLPAAQERSELRRLRHELTTSLRRVRAGRSLVRLASRYLGVSESQLRSRLASGRTLAQVAATTPGRSRAGLVAALVSTRRRAIETALRQKLISAAAARKAIANLHARAERQVDGK